MADKTVEELLAAHKAMVAAMSPEELAAHRAKIIADQLAHARANPYTGGERQAQAEMPKGLVAVADKNTSKVMKTGGAAQRIRHRGHQRDAVPLARRSATDHNPAPPCDEGGVAGVNCNHGE